MSTVRVDWALIAKRPGPRQPFLSVSSLSVSSVHAGRERSFRRHGQRGQLKKFATN
jgi:hypothetical protein